MMCVIFLFVCLFVCVVKQPSSKKCSKIPPRLFSPPFLFLPLRPFHPFLSGVCRVPSSFKEGTFSFQRDCTPQKKGGQTGQC